MMMIIEPQQDGVKGVYDNGGERGIDPRRAKGYECSDQPSWDGLVEEQVVQRYK